MTFKVIFCFIIGSDARSINQGKVLANNYLQGKIFTTIDVGDFDLLPYAGVQGYVVIVD